MNTGRIRALVIEDSLTSRKYLVEVLSADPEIEVVGEAADGKQGIDLCLALRPDVITVDMMMPVMSGVAVTEYIMAYCPTPMLVVSASTNRGELYRTYDALAAGAVDVLDKPSGDVGDRAWERRLCSTVKMVSRIKVITHLRAKLGGRPVVSSAPAPAVAEAHARKRLIAIGASTGGPGAIVDILRGLPGDFPLPILLVLHIGQPFASAFADWLDKQTALRVRYANDGEPLPQPGQPGVIMAPPDRHMVLKLGRLRLTMGPERHSCRPSVDELFESLAREAAPDTIACLLTGMGRDGAAGLLALRRSGAHTVAQDQDTSVIYGMPREAAEMGAAMQVLPLQQIATLLGRMS
jgi:two-component system, chemotaxis family, protein-glutamate methylesterase/glutaminase